MSDEFGDFIGFLTNQKETAVTTDPQPEQTPLERAKELRLKHANHNQASHGFRFGKTPSLEQARRYRKAGVLQDYTKRARDRSGTKPAKERNAAKPKGEEFMGRRLSPRVSNPNQTKKAITFWDRLNRRFPHEEIESQIDRLFEGRAEPHRNGGLIYDAIARHSRIGRIGFDQDKYDDGIEWAMQQLRDIDLGLPQGFSGINRI